MIGKEPIPLRDSLAGIREIQGELRQMMVRSTEVGYSRIQGEPYLLEKKFTTWLGVNHALALSGGVTAVELALRVLGLGVGDSVLVDAFADARTDAAIARLGGQAIPVDVERGYPLMDPEALERVLDSERGQGARAVLVSHRTGHSANLSALEAVARDYNLPVIEDASEAVGAALEGRRCGGIGRMGVFCLGSDRTFSALGAAGLLVTDDPVLHARARDLVATLALSMDGLRAGVAQLSMRNLERGILRRQALAHRYDTAMASLGIRIPGERLEATHIYDQYLARVPVDGHAAAAVRESLIALGLEDEAFHPLTLRDMGEGEDAEGALPNATAWCRDALSLPVYAQIPSPLQGAIIAALTEALS